MEVVVVLVVVVEVFVVVVVGHTKIHHSFWFAHSSTVRKVT